VKLWDILEHEDQTIIHWHLDGNSFKIEDLPRFEREIIPKYFRHTHFSSVKRQLNLYGFRLIQRGDNKGYFFQPQYRRSDITTARNIVRVGAPKKRKSSDGVMSACKRHTRAVAAAEDADYADDDVSDPYLHVSSESEQEDNISDSIHQRHHEDEITPNIIVSATTTCSDKSGSNSTSNQSSLGAFRPSALSSRLGFNMNLLNRYPSHSANNQPSQVYQHKPSAMSSSIQQESSQLSTYGDIDSTSSDLYAIGPSFPDRDYDMMVPSQDGGYNVKSFNVDEMLEFLDNL